MCPPSNFNGLLGAVIKSPRGLPFSRDTIALPGSPRLRPSLQAQRCLLFQAAEKEPSKSPTMAPLRL